MGEHHEGNFPEEVVMWKQGHKGIGKFPERRCHPGRTWRDSSSCEESSRQFKDLELSVTWEPQKDVVERADLHLAVCWEAEEEGDGTVNPPRIRV